MMARSTNALQAEAGYIDARPHQPARGSLLHRTAGPYIRVRPGHCGDVCCTAALPLETEVDMRSCYVAEGRVEDGRGSLGHSATPRFPSPLIEPDVPD